ncbi:ABC transporter ATP-binding protein [Pseudodesulfovibrio sediminis]|uniref:ABC transporter ATP-binding protein n=1 Tax=Pseudodesulfovibrio sediminis TaxID=2810563 RepID=A0ABM7P7A8_9BACT|nr:ABC transporter ATP-binding protein [Pseudodesulfovibrio sediminis]BCS89237.1 ABC transporter ATP-binding protein [Pseudodesulfovibrio sediminis]
MNDSIQVTLKHVSKHFGKVRAVDNIDIEFAPGTLTTLLGPSGCGKTTLLRLVSGLEPATAGEIWFGDENVTALSATRRDVGMVFQSYALFPHMTVEQNVGYGLGVLKVPADETKERVREVLQMVDMDGYQSRYPNELSGGQQQRVAVARAMVLRPKVLLFDEPLSNIDSKLRRSMRDDIRRLQQASGITSIYVTHDQAEALAVSDEIIVMKDGAIEQQGPPRALYHKPETSFVANFIGESNVVKGILSSKGTSKIITYGDATIELPTTEQTDHSDGPVSLSLRPEVIEVVHKSETTEAALSGTIKQNAYMGPVIEYTIDTQCGPLFTRAPAYAGVFESGEEVGVLVRPDEIIVIPENGDTTAA